MDTAAQTAKEQSLGETAGVIVDKAKKSIFKGILGNMDFWDDVLVTKYIKRKKINFNIFKMENF